ncbi:hypothetical protein [Labilibacter marinus]|uniref:hypothetical protein n=1 Tax=Labilibacter marinus TaxID=1477105 RepID=UPI00094F7286|nr:hypothetical protein [Labilibacter marinus]
MYFIGLLLLVIHILGLFLYKKKWQKWLFLPGAGWLLYAWHVSDVQVGAIRADVILFGGPLFLLSLYQFVFFIIRLIYEDKNSAIGDKIAKSGPWSIVIFVAFIVLDFMLSAYGFTIYSKVIVFVMLLISGIIKMNYRKYRIIGLIEFVLAIIVVIAR